MNSIKSMQISNQSIQHLEFNIVLEEIGKFAFSQKVCQEIIQTKPLNDRQQILFLLQSCNEYLSGFQSHNSFPFSEYFEYEQELNHLEIENFHLEVDFFLAIKSNCIQIKQILTHLANFQSYFPILFRHSQKIEYKNEVVKEIDAVFNKLGNIRDTASESLSEIRKKLIKTQNHLSDQFKKALDKNKPYLDEIGESVIENKRVLAVKSMHKRLVKGRFLGTSKTGSISFIEPSHVIQLNRDLEELKDEEQKEIIRILIQLTQIMSQFRPNLIAYQEFLYFLDAIQAKAKFSLLINACLPNVNKNRKMVLLDAFHPLLLLNNIKNKSITISQNIELNENQRMIVISGPNAGGKSITLKTIGLLQLMIQSGILVSVHPKSEFCLFGSIFTDIGDNQSIDNQLSTYSYRLKQMAEFLKKANENSLLLIDEFGTGSDPQLGGALAEVFLETLYDKNVFGVLTTHYTNIKIRTEELDYATNANMLFDKKTLEPLYKLEIGAAGSSFTFEVAEKNQIPFSLINRAKKKLESETRRLDQTIVKLQQEKFQVFKTQNTLNKQSEENIVSSQNLKQSQDKINKKLLDIQLLYDSKSASIVLGEKIEKLITHFLYSKQKKQLVAEFLKLTEAESVKKAKLDPVVKQKQKIIEKSINKELKSSVQKIEIEKVKQKEIEQKLTQNKIESIKQGTRVKIKGSASVGTIEKVEKKYALVNYGNFITKIDMKELEVVS
jgi:DNA mismatch repair protein MutS2